MGSVTRIDGAGYPTLTRYDALGRAWQSQDASGKWLKTQFDARGFAAALCESASGDVGTTCPADASTYTRTLATDARGNVIHERRGGTSALDVIRTFERFTGRLESVCSGGSCGIQDDRYAFDAAGNLVSRDIGGQYREIFSYDPLNRLSLARYERVLSTTWAPGTGPISTEQRYDKLGNLCQKTIGATQQNYSYGGRAGCGLGGTPGSGTTSSIASPHAVSAAAGGSFFYDGHGNQVTADYAGTASDRFIRYSVEQQAHEIALASQTSPSQRSRFWHGSDGQRYKREDTATGQSTKRTLYLGSVEIIQQGGVVTTKRYIAGIVVQDITATATTTQYLFHDHIGSIVRVTNASGGIIEGMDFGAFGERRGYVDPRNLPVFPVSTNRSFTGHEMLDGLDVVHMNGRIYDSKLGRFLQADPIIQEPNNGQNFNRYSYVLNNPLSYTDPSGFSFLKKFRTFAAIAVAIAAPFVAAAVFTNLGFTAAGVAALSSGQAFAAALVGGFASGVISGGNLKSGLFGAFSATLFFGIGQEFANAAAGDFLGSGLSPGAFGAKVLAHGIAGGVMAELQGGKFGHGFASAGVTQAFSGRIDRITGAGASGARVAAAAVVGGTASVLSGGKFANGALTGAFSRAFNDELTHNDGSQSSARKLAEELNKGGGVHWAARQAPDGTWTVQPSAISGIEATVGVELAESVFNATDPSVCRAFCGAASMVEGLALGDVSNSPTTSSVNNASDINENASKLLNTLQQHPNADVADFAKGLSRAPAQLRLVLLIPAVHNNFNACFTECTSNFLDRRSR